MSFVSVEDSATGGGGGGGSVSFATDTSDAGTLVGAINSTNGTDGNGTFTLSQSPLAGSLDLTWRGIRQNPVEHYTLAGSTITFTAGNHPVPEGDGGDNLIASYAY